MLFAATEMCMASRALKNRLFRGNQAASIHVLIQLYVKLAAHEVEIGLASVDRPKRGE